MEIPPFPESGWEKTKRKFKEEPLVPIGCVLTAGVLVGGLRSFMTMADQKTQQRYMRARVIAQGATVVAVAFGSFMTLREKQKKNATKNE
jgi:hypothetical protein